MKSRWKEIKKKKKRKLRSRMINFPRSLSYQDDFKPCLFYSKACVLSQDPCTIVKRLDLVPIPTLTLGQSLNLLSLRFLIY